MDVFLLSLVAAIVVLILESLGLEHVLVRYHESFDDTKYIKKCFFILPVWAFIILVLRLSPLLVVSFVVFPIIIFVRCYTLCRSSDLYTSGSYFSMGEKHPIDIRENMCQYCVNYKSYLCAICSYKEAEEYRIKMQEYEDYLKSLTPEELARFYRAKQEDTAKQAEEERARKEREEEERQRVFREYWQTKPNQDHFQTSNYGDYVCAQRYSVCETCVYKFVRGTVGCRRTDNGMEPVD